MIGTEEIFVKTSKEYSLAATRFSSTYTNSKTVVISSATGVLQKYYFKIARYFAKSGYIVYTFDYYGIGQSGSKIDTLKKNSTTLSEWGSIDQAAIIEHAKKEFPQNKITLLTHSVGGQVLGFNSNYNYINNIITVASQGGFWGHFYGLHKPKMWLFWHVMIPAITPIFGYFPAKKLGLFENLPKKVVHEWAKWGQHKDYMMGHFNFEDTYFGKIDTPMLILSFPRDSYAPKRSVDWLADQYKNARIDRKHIIPEESGLEEIGHFGFFREKFSDSLWKMALEWIEQN